MKQTFFVGVDGGATKCIVRVEDAQGQLVGRECSGPANIRISVEQAWQSIEAALEKILRPKSISYQQGHLFHAGMGLAGCEVINAYQSFLHHAHPFQTLVVTSDAHTACLGAHSGKAGAIIIAGTGVVGFQSEETTTAKVGGWGFPHDDDGGGAWLGLQAVRLTVQWQDGRLPASALAQAVYQRFHQDDHHLVAWANQANSTAFAELAPLVIQAAQTGDAAAVQLMLQAAKAIESISEALLAKQAEVREPLPCSLIGGIAEFIQPYLSETLRARLHAAAFTPDSGAIFLIKKTGKDNDRHSA